MGDFEGNSSNDRDILIFKWETSDVDNILGTKGMKLFCYGEVCFLNFALSYKNTPSHICVTIDGVWICGPIYWPLIHTTRNFMQLQRHR
jgi:hypothetical protein